MMYVVSEKDKSVIHEFLDRVESEDWAHHIDEKMKSDKDREEFRKNNWDRFKTIDYYQNKVGVSVPPEEDASLCREFIKKNQPKSYLVPEFSLVMDNDTWKISLKEGGHPPGNFTMICRCHHGVLSYALSCYLVAPSSFCRDEAYERICSYAIEEASRIRVYEKKAFREQEDLILKFRDVFLSTEFKRLFILD